MFLEIIIKDLRKVIVVIPQVKLGFMKILEILTRNLSLLNYQRHRYSNNFCYPTDLTKFIYE